MRISLQRPRTRRDCILDSRLSPEQADALSRRLDDGLPLADAARELLAQPGIKVSTSAISRWAAKRRKAKSERTFAQLQEAVDTERERSGRLGSATSFLEANLVLASRALFAAQCNDDAHGMLRALKILAGTGSVVAQAKRAEAAQVTAQARETLAGIAVRKMDAEDARAEAARAAEAERIRQQDPEVQREKMERVRERMFGKPPQWIVEANEELRRQREAAPPARPPVDVVEATETPEVTAPEPAPAEQPAPAPPPAEAKPQPAAGRGHTLVSARRIPDAHAGEPWLKPGEWFRLPPMRGPEGTNGPVFPTKFP